MSRKEKKSGTGSNPESELPKAQARVTMHQIAWSADIESDFLVANNHSDCRCVGVPALR